MSQCEPNTNTINNWGNGEMKHVRDAYIITEEILSEMLECALRNQAVWQWVRSLILKNSSWILKTVKEATESILKIISWIWIPWKKYYLLVRSFIFLFCFCTFRGSLVRVCKMSWHSSGSSIQPFSIGVSTSHNYPSRVAFFYAATLAVKVHEVLTVERSGKISIDPATVPWLNSSLWWEGHNE